MLLPFFQLLTSTSFGLEIANDRGRLEQIQIGGTIKPFAFYDHNGEKLFLIWPELPGVEYRFKHSLHNSSVLKVEMIMAVPGATVLGQLTGALVPKLQPITSAWDVQIPPSIPFGRIGGANGLFPSIGYDGMIFNVGDERGY